MRAERVLIARRDAPGHDALALILAQRVVRIRYLNPIPSGEQVQMQGVMTARLIVESVEDRLIVANAMERRELRRVEKTAATDAIQRKEIARARIAEAKARRPSRCAKRAVSGVEVPKHPPRAQSGSCRDIRDEAG